MQRPASALDRAVGQLPPPADPPRSQHHPDHPAVAGHASPVDRQHAPPRHMRRKIPQQTRLIEQHIPEPPPDDDPDDHRQNHIADAVRGDRDEPAIGQPLELKIPGNKGQRIGKPIPPDPERLGESPQKGVEVVQPGVSKGEGHTGRLYGDIARGIGRQSGRRH